MKTPDIVTLSQIEVDVKQESKIPLPSHFFIIDCLGNYVFVKTRSRAKAQEAVDNEYGKHKYTVRTI